MTSSSPLSHPAPPKILFLSALLAGLALIGSMFALGIPRAAATGPGLTFIRSVLALDSAQSLWYITRAAGLTSYLLLWMSMVWGLAAASRFFQPAIEGSQAYDFHEFLSLLAIGFAALHVTVLLFDRYLPFTVSQILVPFASAYRPLWVGLGVIGLYLCLLVTATFYARRIIGARAFRGIHILSLPAYVGLALHGLFAGTDSALSVTRLLYLATFLPVVFLTGYWLVLNALARRERRPRPA